MKVAAVAVMLAVALGGVGAMGAGRSADQQNYLWVMDNSGSMQSRRVEIAGAFLDFAAELAKHGVTKYKMAVTTTDAFWLQGKLVEFEGVRMVSHDSANPAKQFSAIVGEIADSPTSFWEQGLENSYLALQGDAKFLLEEGVPLNVIYVSDENDYSCKEHCFGVEPENNKDWIPHGLERYLTYFRGLDVPVHIYSVVGMEDGLCSLASVGERYMTVQKEFHGFSASVCPTVVRKNILRIAEDSASHR